MLDFVNKDSFLDIDLDMYMGQLIVMLKEKNDKNYELLKSN
jgi:hypothetical protein